MTEVFVGSSPDEAGEQRRRLRVVGELEDVLQARQPSHTPGRSRYIKPLGRLSTYPRRFWSRLTVDEAADPGSVGSTPVAEEA